VAKWVLGRTKLASPQAQPSARPDPARPVLQNFVGGQLVPARDGATSEVVDPSTGEAYLRAPVCGPADVDAALRTAGRAFETWRDTTPAERSLALLRFADAIEARAEDLVEAESRNTGKPVAMTRADEVPPLADELRFFAGAARNLEGKAAGEYLRGHTSMTRREPIGVCAQVTPWNYPMMMAVWKLAPALAAGNTVVLKPSDTTPVSTLLLAEIAA
jgi:betaine-aldehyde dehydrogenase